ncbi:Holliday junction branch migration protein RuvA [Clostridium hydrogeniformans]|uniref:Holliday junction branch migration protein RuvA n=1 Tax=Clostridium hydrogeniformans TaxID=349933 RepID=UPI0004825E2C|nr:Holliday junction branch migration protein RuvA [Clostridium hydrogeniformans]
MFEYIKGKFMGINKDYIIIENNEIAYKVYTSGNTMAQMPSVEEKVMVYIEQIVRQDFIGLYGFYTKEELDMFKLLITINGVGAKAALSLLSICSVNNFKYAVLTGDEKTIVRAPGVGKKIAQRIILELKDKFKINEKLLEGDGISLHKEEDLYMDNKINDALEALISLGYSEKESNKALSKVDNSKSLEEIIKDGLKHLIS